jgi:hypothetical protein
MAPGQYFSERDAAIILVVGATVPDRRIHARVSP